MRISDWSSDVCSSDLRIGVLPEPMPFMSGLSWLALLSTESLPDLSTPSHAQPLPKRVSAAWVKASLNRSEEHTSELQSLMRISYAVFCLKKKQHKNETQDRTQRDES